MIEKARDLRVEHLLTKFGLHWHWEDAVPIDAIAPDPNPARWRARYDELHKVEIGVAILDDLPVPAFLLYQPAGLTRYQQLGGRHRKEACIDLKRANWPAYVIDELLDEFLIEALPIYDNVGQGKEYSKSERLELAAHLLAHKDRDPRSIASAMQLKVVEITQFVDLQAALNRADGLSITTELRKLPVSLQIEANKILPNDPIFKAVVGTLAFTEMQGNAAKGLIKDAQCARTEAQALKKLTDIYEKHKAEIERRKRGGRKPTPTIAQRYRRAIVILETVWPGRVELMEITAHDDEFIADLEQRLMNNRAHMNEVIDRCAEVRGMREKYPTGEARPGWQARLRTRLTVGASQPPVAFGELFDQIAPLIPRHETERAWHRRHGSQQELVAPNRKIAHMIQLELQRYRLEVFGTERAHGKQWTRETRIRAIARACAFCGASFVANRVTATCSRSHASKLSRGEAIEVHADAHQEREPTMARSVETRHPEIAAIEMIFDALRPLDQGARERVLAYAKHLIDSDKSAPTPQLRAVSGE